MVELFVAVVSVGAADAVAIVERLELQAFHLLSLMPLFLKVFVAAVCDAVDAVAVVTAVFVEWLELQAFHLFLSLMLLFLKVIVVVVGDGGALDVAVIVFSIIALDAVVDVVVAAVIVKWLELQTFHS